MMQDFPLVVVDLLAVVKFTPLFITVLIGWILSVAVHEFSHALFAYWGGDRSVKERGYLHFDLLSYIDPVTSILIPAIFLALGGLPLPGGAVRIDRSALRSRNWECAVSAAGPLANLVMFALIAVVLNPNTGLVDPGAFDQPNWVKMLGALSVLQVMAFFFNLIPVPPLDGFGMLAPYMDYHAREKAERLGFKGLIAIFLAFTLIPPVNAFFFKLVDRVLEIAGLPYEVTWRQFNLALFGSSE